MRLLSVSLLLASTWLSAGATAANLSEVANAAAHYYSGQSTEALRELDLQLAASTGNRELQRGLEAALVRLLQPDAAPEAMLFACQRLATVGTDASLPALATLLKNPDTVGMACLALGNYPLAKADAILRDALPHLEGTAKVQVVATLGHRRDSESAKPLTALTQDPNPEVAAAAAIALGRIADPVCRRTLANLRAKTPRPVILEASLLLADTLVARGDRGGAIEVYRDLAVPSRPPHIRAGAFGRWLQLEKDEGVDHIEAVLRDRSNVSSEDPLRPVAIAAIGRLQLPNAPARFARLLPTLPDWERSLLLDALADFGPNAPRTPMAAELAATNAQVRLAAIRAFARLNSPSDIPVFVDALAKAGTAQERQTAESALIQLPGGPTTDQALLAALTAAPAAAKPSLLTAIGRRGARNAVPAMLALCSSLDPLTTKAAWQGLGRLATASDLPAMLDRAITAQSATARDTAMTALAPVLNRIPDETARFQPIDARLAAAPDTPTRAFLIRLLPLAGGAAALQAAQTSANDPDPAVREAGVRALGDWPTADAWEPLTALYRDPTVPSHQTFALRGLVRLAQEENAHPADLLFAHYDQLFAAARNDDDRRLILGALGGCAHPKALLLALQQLDNPAVRPEVVQAVKRIADAIKGAHPNEAEAALRRLAAPN